MRLWYKASEWQRCFLRLLLASFLPPEPIPLVVLLSVSLGQAHPLRWMPALRSGNDIRYSTTRRNHYHLPFHSLEGVLRVTSEHVEKNPEVDGLWELRNKACGWPLKKAGWNARGTCIVLCNYNKYCSKGRWLAGTETWTV